MNELDSMGRLAQETARVMSRLSGGKRNESLRNLSEALLSRSDEILRENASDISTAGEKGLSDAFLDRLLLTTERIESMASDVSSVAALPDPVGESTDMKVMPNGIQVGRRRVPLGVIGVIYESRPNITVDISCLCIKSGNSVILRGGSDASSSNNILSNIIRESISECGIPEDCIQLVQDNDRELVSKMLKMDRYIDLMIPRGGKDLVDMVGREATMPAITGGVGVCHTYIDESASLEMALEILINAKVQRPTVCNALDTVLLHSSKADSFLPNIAKAFSAENVQMRCDPRAFSILDTGDYGEVIPAKQEDWETEHLSLIAGVKIVDSIQEAIAHIYQYGTGHTEVIVTENYSSANQFLDEIDASAVMVNASSRFNDGGQFGLGAEVAISTNKMHARGPMGLRELTSYKWIVMGQGHIRT